MTKSSPLPIARASHPLARQARELKAGPSQRRRAGLFLVEGPRAIEEGLASQARFAWVMVARGKRERFAAWLTRLASQQVAIHEVEDELLIRLSPTEHGQGLLAAVALPPDADDLPLLLARVAGDATLRLLVLWNLQQPGNTGTLLRSAAAFGWSAVLTVGGADPWNEKAVRASAGAIHRLQVARAVQPDAALLASLANLNTVAALAHGGRPPESIDWTKVRGLILGSETEGLPSSFAQSATPVTIPLGASIESLGVAMAGSILMALGRRAPPAR